jgi:iron complex transport system substrate-binding protein
LIRAVSFMAGTVHPELLGDTSSSETSSSSNSSSQVEVEINLNQTLRSGMQNDDVLKLQERLEELGYMFVKPTGLYAEATVQSVKDFQYLNGMTVTGVADPETLKKIFSPDAIRRTDQND